MSASCDEATRRLSTDAVFPWGRWVSDDSVVKRRRRCKGTALVNAVTGDGVRISADRNPSAQEREARSLAHRDADRCPPQCARRCRSVSTFGAARARIRREVGLAWRVCAAVAGQFTSRVCWEPCWCPNSLNPVAQSSALQQTSSSIPSGSRKNSDHSLPSRWISPTSWAPATRSRSLTASSVARESTARAKWSMAPRLP
jgi:hypothetical protein